tara:strand:+ start:1146 stop:1766 length:621 start_codon:yes stop_codon:yes gene_type:complete
MIDTVEHFKKEKYVVSENFIDKDTAFLLYHYVKNQALAVDYKYVHQNKYYHKEIDGKFDDPQAPGDFSKYGDPFFDTLLNLTCEKMSNISGIDLVPTYSYHRLYTTNTELKRHLDRDACEISATLCLGYDSEENWPMFVKKQNGEEIGLDLSPGSIIVYRGCDIEHWREPFKGKNHAQVFLHYNEKNGEFNNIYDNRKVLGVNPRV